MEILTIIVAVLSSSIISAAIAIKITAEAMRALEEHAENIHEANISYTHAIEKIVLSSIEDFVNQNKRG